MLGIVWNNGTYGYATQAIGHKGTAPQGGTTGETVTSADERQLESVSAVAVRIALRSNTSNKNPLPLGRGVCQPSNLFKHSININISS